MQQYFVSVELKINDVVYFDNEQTHHIVKVMRFKSDDIVKVVDGNGKGFETSLCIDNVKCSGIVISEFLLNNEMDIDVTLVMALIKKDKWDYMLMKCSELGVKKIVPLQVSRCVVKSDDEKTDKKLVRYQKIVTQACEQCKRNSIPQVTKPITLKQLKDYTSDLNLVAFETVKDKGLKMRDVIKSNKSITVVIGPEGGFSDSEVLLMNEMGFNNLSLGKRILRAETAATYVLCAIDALCE